MKTVASREILLRQLRAAVEPPFRASRLSGARFDQTHDLFESSSNQQHRIREWLAEFIGSHDGTQEPLKVLSIGCGSGILDNPLIATLAKTLKRIEYTGVDPNTVACRRFREDFEKLGLPNVQLELVEEGVESLASNDYFHIIHLVHSLYYFKDPASTLDALLKRLAPHGRLVIVQAPEAELNQLANCFWPHHEETGIWFSDRLTDHLTTSEHAFSKQRIDAEVDVTRCFATECSQGEMLIDFITQSDCRQLDEATRQLCLDYLHAICREEDETLLAPHPADLFVIE